MSAETESLTEPDLLDDLELSKEDCRELFRLMCLQREFEDRLSILYRQGGRLEGAVYAGKGHEAIAAGSSYVMQNQDILVPLHRTIATHFRRGNTPKDMMCQYMGRANGPTRGKDGNMHCGDWDKKIVGMISHLGSNIPTAAGIALACKLQKLDSVALTFIGEGATSIGDFHEGLNFAAVQKLPMVLIIDNNGYAYSTPTSFEYACEELIDRAEGYGMPGELIDGTNVLAVYRATKSAFERARSGGGPTLIEAKTYRMTNHSLSDPGDYVTEAYKEEASANDPLLRCEREWIEFGYCTPEDIDAIKEDCKTEIDEAVDYAENSPLPAPEEALTGVYAD